MANLRANKITSTEVFETTGSVQFDGSGDYLSLASSSDFAFGTGDFTIEFWFYSYDVSGSTQRGFFQTSDTAGGLKTTYTSGIVIVQGSNNTGTPLNGGLCVIVAGTILGSSTSVLSTGTWYHCALTRQSGVCRVFLNGSLIDSKTIAGSIDGTNLVVGGYYNTSFLLNGHLSNFRVLKGTALYTKNFTPPTRELTVIPNTVLLACQSTTNTAQEATGKTITVNGNAVANELTPGLLTDVVKSGGTSAITGSVEFDGNDYLSLADSIDFDIGLNNQPFTWELWFYKNSPNSVQHMLGLGRGGELGEWNSTTGHQYIGFQYTNGSLYWQFWSGSGLVSIQSSTTAASIGSWHHYAVSYDGTTTRAFLNGVLFGSSTSNYGKPSASSITRIGAGPEGTVFSQSFQSNIRVIKGTALYTSDFIPPTRELKNIPGTVLLCCKDSNDPTAEETGKTITANGDPTGSNFTPQVGSDGSVEFAGPTKINSENYFYLPTGTTEQRDVINNNYGARGILGGGYNGSVWINSLQYVTIATTGNALDFGDLSSGRPYVDAVSSATRGVFGGGEGNNTMDYITIASTGNAQDFGDSTSARRDYAGCSNSIRGLFGGGQGTNIIDYVTIASKGDAQDFGDLTQGKYFLGGCSSPTRGVFAGGDTGAPAAIKNINYVTIASTGNAQTFGDLTISRSSVRGCSNSIRGVFSGGYTLPGSTNTMDYITISSTGTATDFGDMITARGINSAISSSLRGLFTNWTPSTGVSAIDYINITSTSNALDFGDTITQAQGGTSNGHGGLG